MLIDYGLRPPPPSTLLCFYALFYLATLHLFYLALMHHACAGLLFYHRSIGLFFMADRSANDPAISALEVWKCFDMLRYDPGINCRDMSRYPFFRWERSAGLTCYVTDRMLSTGGGVWNLCLVTLPLRNADNHVTEKSISSGSCYVVTPVTPIV